MKCENFVFEQKKSENANKERDELIERKSF